MTTGRGQIADRETRNGQAETQAPSPVTQEEVDAAVAAGLPIDPEVLAALPDIIPPPPPEPIAPDDTPPIITQKEIDAALDVGLPIDPQVVATESVEVAPVPNNNSN